MPSSPTYMKLKSQKAESNIGAKKEHLSKEEKDKKRKAMKDQEPTSKVGPWLLGLLFFVVIGSSFLQIITNIQTQPSMSQEH